MRRALTRTLFALLAALCVLASSALGATSTRRPGGLSVTRLELVRSIAAPGAALRYADAVRNAGRRKSPRARLVLWLSEDARRGLGDVRLASRAVRRLAPGRASQARRDVVVPATVAPGTYRLVACLTGFKSASCRVAAKRVRIEARSAAPAPPAEAPAPGPDPFLTPAPAPETPVLAPAEVTAPAVGLATPADGAVLGTATPVYGGSAGVAPGDAAVVTLRVFAGLTATGTPVAEVTVPVDEAMATWSATPPDPLPDGVYTAQATQADAGGNTATSSPHSFAVDTTAPVVTLDRPADGALTNAARPLLDGTAGTATGDGPVQVDLYAGGTPAGSPVQTLEAVPASDGTWSVTPSTDLADGQYTVRARQEDTAGNDGASAAHGFTVDATPPAVTFGAPADGSSTTEPKPLFDGTAGTAAGDGDTVTVKIFDAAAPSGPPVRTLTASVTSGAWSVIPSTAIPEGDYVARAEQADLAGNTATTPAHAFSIMPAHLLAAGDIASCQVEDDSRTAQLLAGRTGTVAPLGDLVYGDGTLADEGSLSSFNACYGPNWGQQKDRSKPVPGNHEYANPPAGGYFSYFGSTAGDADKGYYSYDLGSWHVVALNTNRDCADVPCGTGSAQETWLKADLAAHPASCILAYFHQPLFTSDANTGAATSTNALWRALENAGAEVILNAHAHNYERFAPQTRNGVASATGIREFVVGTGGKSLSALGATAANSEVRDNTSFGILDLTLRQGGYDWRFVPATGTFTDAGSASCR